MLTNKICLHKHDLSEQLWCVHTTFIHSKNSFAKPNYLEAEEKLGGQEHKKGRRGSHINLSVFSKWEESTLA